MAVRFGTAAATAGLVLLLALAAAFTVDYIGNLAPLQRAVALLAIAFGAGWIASAAVGRWLNTHETETDLALEMERRCGGDLVAAMQFQGDDRGEWGSLELEQAVVVRVDEASRELDVFDGFSWAPLPRRLLVLACVTAAVLLPAVVYPRHREAFLDRLMLADVPYPTRTVITSVSINGKAVDLSDSTPLRAPAGSPLTFAVTVDGVKPSAGEVVLRGDAGGTTEVELSRRSRDESLEAKAEGAGHAADGALQGTLDALREPVVFTVRVGDARTRERRIELVPLPVVTLDVVPTPPEYARGNAPAAPPAGVRTAFVLEGSDVALVVRAVNKRLERVAVEIAGVAQDRSGRVQEDDDRRAEPLALNPSPQEEGGAALSHGAEARGTTIPMWPDDHRRTWTLDPAGTRFDNVREGFSFRIVAVDEDGLSPAAALTGSIRLRADRPPRVAAAAVVTRVLPAGRPQIAYGASDDFGLKEVRAAIAVNRVDGRVEERVVPLPVEREAANEVRGRQGLDLAPFRLAKGDKIVVTVEAEDARGDRPGETARAEAITFEVTDREGLLASLLEADEEGAERLDAIIQRELGIGEGR